MEYLTMALPAYMHRDAVLRRMEATHRRVHEGVLIRLFRLLIAVVLWTFFAVLLALVS